MHPMCPIALSAIHPYCARKTHIVQKQRLEVRECTKWVECTCHSLVTRNQNLKFQPDRLPDIAFESSQRLYIFTHSMNRGTVPEMLEFCNFRYSRVTSFEIVGIEPERLVCPKVLSHPDLRVVHQHWHTHNCSRRGKSEKASGIVPLNIVFSKYICFSRFTD